jgi:hypothetical protein
MTMSTASKVALAIMLMFGLGSSAFAASGKHDKPAHHRHAQKVQQHAPPTAQKSQSQGCMNDEGGGRFRPCGEGGGGGGGGGY